MPIIKPDNPTVDKMEFEVDLEKEFGFKISSQAVKEDVGQAIIDQLVSRTQNKQKLTGGKFTKYSEKYAEKKGVGVNDVNLTLTEEMLSSINVIAKKGSQKIKINIDPDQAPKAFNHHTGDTLPKREWFGIQQKELNNIIKQYKKEAKQVKARSKEDDEIEAIVNKLTQGLIDFG